MKRYYFLSIPSDSEVYSNSLYHIYDYLCKTLSFGSTAESTFLEVEGYYRDDL